MNQKKHTKHLINIKIYRLNWHGSIFSKNTNNNPIDLYKDVSKSNITHKPLAWRRVGLPLERVDSEVKHPALSRSKTLFGYSGKKKSIPATLLPLKLQVNLSDIATEFVSETWSCPMSPMQNIIQKEENLLFCVLFP